MKDLDLINICRLVSDEISDIYSWDQLLKLSGFVWIAFGFDEDVYFICIRLEVMKDRFPGVYYPLNRYNVLLKYFVRGLLI